MFHNEEVLMGNMNQLSFAKQQGIIVFPRPCTFCDSNRNVALTFGLWVCESCVSNINQANSDVLHLDNKKLPVNL